MDNHKGVFNVEVTAASSVHTQVSNIDGNICTYSAQGLYDELKHHVPVCVGPIPG